MKQKTNNYLGRSSKLNSNFGKTSHGYEDGASLRSGGKSQKTVFGKSELYQSQDLWKTNGLGSSMNVKSGQANNYSSGHSGFNNINYNKGSNLRPILLKVNTEDFEIYTSKIIIFFSDFRDICLDGLKLRRIGQLEEDKHRQKFSSIDNIMAATLKICKAMIPFGKEVLKTTSIPSQSNNNIKTENKGDDFNQKQEIKKIEMKYKIMLDLAEENVAYLENKNQMDNKTYQDIIQVSQNKQEDIQSLQNAKEKLINSLQTEKIDLQSKINILENSNKYEAFGMQKSQTSKYCSYNKNYQNSMNKDEDVPSIDESKDDVLNFNNNEIEKKEFELYRKILDDTKAGLSTVQSKQNKINSLLDIAKQNDISHKKNDMELCKLRININDRNTQIASLQKTNSSLNFELKKISDKEIEEEHQIWTKDVNFCYKFFFQ